MTSAASLERSPMALGKAPLEVIVVDDDDLTRRSVAKAVRSLGHHCREAKDGVEALDLWSASHANVVISDWDMPRMNGAELCRRTRRVDVEAPYTYFILMSAFDDREHLISGMEAGADDYQQKPVDLDELEARLLSAERVIELHQQLADRTTSLRCESERFYLASRTDSLTLVGNRLAFAEELDRIRARVARYGHRLSLAMCDVDEFKRFNDAFGHQAGDNALAHVADAIRSTLRATDSVYRYGGEEFVVLLPEQHLDEAVRAMDRVRAAVEQLMIPAPNGGVLTISAGVSELGNGSESASGLVARADAALYMAKAHGRNRVETLSKR
jgi:diguanylate cyclase (GGDEF)-like protein